MSRSWSARYRSQIPRQALRHGVNQRRIERYLRAIAEAPRSPLVA